MDIDSSVGYELKRASWALRGAMDQVLRELALTVPQYACLELLAQRPGISNADLARGVFVTRQATHQLLASLTRAGLVDVSGTGRAQRLTLTAHGSAVLAAASTAVAAIEERMLSALSPEQRADLQAGLRTCTDALAKREPAPPG